MSSGDRFFSHKKSETAERLPGCQERRDSVAIVQIRNSSEEIVRALCLR